MRTRRPFLRGPGPGPEGRVRDVTLGKSDVSPTGTPKDHRDAHTPGPLQPVSPTDIGSRVPWTSLFPPPGPPPARWISLLDDTVHSSRPDTDTGKLFLATDLLGVIEHSVL